MKIKVFNIKYLFENDNRYTNGYLQENPDITYDEQIAYLNEHREIEITFDELIEDEYIQSPEEWHQLTEADINEILVDCITQITGEYFGEYEYKLLAE